MRNFTYVTFKWVLSLLRSSNIINQQNSDVWVLVRLRESKIQNKLQLCYSNAYSYIVHIKRKDIYDDIAKDTETRFDTSNYELRRSLPREKIEN